MIEEGSDTVNCVLSSVATTHAAQREGGGVRTPLHLPSINPSMEASLVSLFPQYLRTPNNQILGSVTTNHHGQRELRNPQGLFVGMYDARQDVTRDRNNFIVGSGDQTARLLNERASLRSRL